jgi:hypothetical protein
MIGLDPDSSIESFYAFTASASRAPKPFALRAEIPAWAPS